MDAAASVRNGPDPAAGVRTKRLLLRRWRADDRAPFAALNTDPEVMRSFPGVLDRAAPYLE